jgi:hypothetical protein
VLPSVIEFDSLWHLSVGHLFSSCS